LHKDIIFRKIIEEDLHLIYPEGLNEPEFIDLPFAWNSENIAKVFTSESVISFIALKKKKLIGFILGRAIENDSSYIHWIMVSEKFRKTGIGKELLRLFIEASKERGAEKFLTSPLKNSHKIIEFFSNNGFSVKESYSVLKR